MKPTYLAIQNPHPFDERISFVEETHIYTIDGDSSFTSVTTFLHQHFPHFDAEKVIASLLAPQSLFRGKMYPNKNKYRVQAFKNIRDDNNNSDSIASDLLNNPDSPEYKREVKKIADEWSKNSVSGTETHANIEYFYNEIHVNNKSKEFAYFMDFHRDFQLQYPNYRPYRTEWTVFHKELKLAGSIDMVYENIDDGTLMIYDWKRVKSIEYEAFGNATATSPHLPDIPNSNFWHYSLQLNTYKAILESQYDKTVTQLMLVRLYPDAPAYELHECANMQSEVKALFDERRELLSINI